MSKMRELQALIEAHEPCTIDQIAHLIDSMTIAQARGLAACLVTDNRLTVAEPAIKSGPNRRGPVYARGSRARAVPGAEFWKRQVPSVFHLADFT